MTKKLFSAGLLLGFSAIAVSLLPQASLAQDFVGFKLPSGNIACAAYDGELRCDLRENQAKIPARPRNCEGDWGNYFMMKSKGAPMRMCVGDTVFGNYPTLAYGKTWKAQGFTCTASMSGLTCRNSANKGWFLNKVEQRFF